MTSRRQGSPFSTHGNRTRITGTGLRRMRCERFPSAVSAHAEFCSFGARVRSIARSTSNIARRAIRRGAWTGLLREIDGGNRVRRRSWEYCACEGRPMRLADGRELGALPLFPAFPGGSQGGGSPEREATPNGVTTPSQCRNPRTPGRRSPAAPLRSPPVRQACDRRDRDDPRQSCPPAKHARG